MSREALEEWLIDDPVTANEWMVERRFRRQDEINKMRETAGTKEKAETFLKQQEESVKRLTEKFPNIRPEKRAKELLALGKTPEEAHGILSNEFPEFKAMNDLMAEHPEFYKRIDFGDIVAEELTKRLKTKEASNSDDKKKMFTEDEVKKAVEEAFKMEQQRRNNIDVGAGSNSGGLNLDKLSPEEEMLKSECEKIQRMGIKVDVDGTIKHHRFRQTQPHLSVEEIQKKS